jgi:hypothetical protein
MGVGAFEKGSLSQLMRFGKNQFLGNQFLNPTGTGFSTRLG